MAKRAAKRQRTRQGSRESRQSQKRRSISMNPWLVALAVVLLILVVGGIFYSTSTSSEQASSASIAGIDVGGDVGDQVPGFDMRLVNGSTINSTELVSAEKPAFYFFFATW